MAKGNEKPKKDNMYKAFNAKKFSASYTDVAPYYDQLCSGESVAVDLKDEQVKMWLANKIIVKG